MSGSYSLFAGDTDLHHALIKLEAVLPEEYRADVEVARQHILFDTSAWCNQVTTPTYLETIRLAVLGSYQLDIFYPGTLCPHSADTAGHWLRIEPYGLVFKGLSRRHLRTGRWYLVAYCQPCQSFHPFRVSDIERICVREEQVTPRPNFNLYNYWRKARKSLEEQASPTVMTLCVSPTARYGLRGDVTILKEKSDGSAIVQIAFEALDDAVSYALGLGADAIILDPPQVRAVVARTAHAIAEMYD